MSKRKTNQAVSVSQVDSVNPKPAINTIQLNPSLRMVKNLTDQGEYERALSHLAKYTTDTEILNSRGVCLMRLHRFADAIGPFRMAALNMGTMRVHEHIAAHIKTNFALALFFGGFPAGGLYTLAELDCPADDPTGLIIRKQAQKWEQSMNWMQRFCWRTMRIAPSVAPPLPAEPVGQFVWDVQVPD